MSGSKNPFYDPEDEVDDEEFLRHSRSGKSGYSQQPQRGFGAGAGTGTGATRRDLSGERRQALAEKRREIEERTVESSQRSIGLLYESEKVGMATAEELNRQKEQLKSTENRLDDINSTLKQSERHLTGIKSVFGGLRNYFAGGSKPPPQQPMGRGNPIVPNAATGRSMADSSGALCQEESARLDAMRNSNHPGLRVRGLADNQLEARGTSANVDAILDRNLDEMSLGLSRLKGLAQGLNQELEEHDDIIGRLDHKTSTTQWRVEKQNKDMNKILGKK